MEKFLSWFIIEYFGDYETLSRKQPPGLVYCKLKSGTFVKKNLLGLRLCPILL